jgi:glycosyltransferase involved in cell wall biosynthesis
MNSNEKIRYSICICNYNMADTIERSLISLLTQINDDFEVIIVDDGSNDASVSIIRRLQSSFNNLRLIALERNKKRRLGLTRNISIKEARGDYVILHLDCDDIFGPHIQDFVKVFRRIEKCIGMDILVSGQHINMARREFLLAHGPYINIYRGEDRNLWTRMAKINAWIPLDHIDFITRLPKESRKKLKKNINDTFDHMKNDFKSGVTLRKYISYEIKKRKLYPLKFFIFRMAMLLPSWFFSLFEDPISQEGTLGSPEAFASYRERVRGTYPEVMARYGCDPSLSFLDNDSRRIFAGKTVSK